MGKPQSKVTGFRISPAAEAKLQALTQATRRGRSQIIELLLDTATVREEPDINVPALAPSASASDA